MGNDNSKNSKFKDIVEKGKKNKTVLFIVFSSFLFCILFSLSLYNTMKYSRILSVFSIIIPLAYWLLGKIDNKKIKIICDKYEASGMMVGI